MSLVRELDREWNRAQLAHFNRYFIFSEFMKTDNTFEISVSNCGTNNAGAKLLNKKLKKGITLASTPAGRGLPVRPLSWPI